MAQEWDSSNIDERLDILDESIAKLQALQKKLNFRAGLAQNVVFESMEVEDYDFSAYDTASDADKEQMKERYMEILKADKDFAKDITDNIPGIAGINTVAKYAFKTKSKQINLKKLGFSKLDANSEGSLLNELKTRKIEIETMNANFVALGNIELKVKIKNNSNKPIRFELKTGQVFEPSDDEEKQNGEQQMIGINENTKEYVPAGTSKEFTWICSCLDRDANVPRFSEFKPTLLKLDAQEKAVKEVENIINNYNDFAAKVEKAKQREEIQRSTWKTLRERQEKLTKFNEKMS